MTNEAADKIWYFSDIPSSLLTASTCQMGNMAQFKENQFYSLASSDNIFRTLL